jgi:hypothetical protein
MTSSPFEVAHSGIVGRGGAFGRIARVCWKHVIEFGHFQSRVANHRVGDSVALGSSMSAAHLPWLLTGSTVSPMTLRIHFG